MTGRRWLGERRPKGGLTSIGWTCERTSAKLADERQVRAGARSLACQSERIATRDQAQQVGPQAPTCIVSCARFDSLTGSAREPRSRANVWLLAWQLLRRRPKRPSPIG